jgi:hypothetical protein
MVEGHPCLCSGHGAGSGLGLETTKIQRCSRRPSTGARTGAACLPLPLPDSWSPLDAFRRMRAFRALSNPGAEFVHPRALGTLG